MGAFALEEVAFGLVTGGIGTAAKWLWRLGRWGRGGKKAKLACAPKGGVPGEYLTGKAPKQVTPGTRKLRGQYKNDQGRIEPWEAHYDEYGRQVGRTDYNAGNKAADIPDTHHHKFEYGPGRNGAETGSHLQGEYEP